MSLFEDLYGYGANNGLFPEYQMGVGGCSQNPYKLGQWIPVSGGAGAFQQAAAQAQFDQIRAMQNMIQGGSYDSPLNDDQAKAYRQHLEDTIPPLVASYSTGRDDAWMPSLRDPGAPILKAAAYLAIYPAVYLAFLALKGLFNALF